MRRIFSCLMIIFLAVGLLVNEASAKRFGGGRSFGTYRSNHSYSSPAYSKTTTNKKQGSSFKWGGMLGGLLAGGLLASLFMHNGLGGSLLSLLIIGAVLLFIISLLRRKTQPAWQSAQSQTNHYHQTNPVDTLKQAFSPFGHSANNPPPLPTGFIADDFLRDAKVKFFRLQTAYTQKNLADLTEFTTPDVLAEIKLQFQERGNDHNETEVISLDAELLDVSVTTASVRFTGMIKEDTHQPIPFNEIWHFRLLDNTNHWIVSGVQQN